MERREGGGRGREGGGARITDLHTQCNHIPGHLPLILQVEEEVLNCQSICHNIDAPKQRGLQWRCGGVDRGEGYRGVHKEEESSIMHKQRLGWSHAHTCTHTVYTPLLLQLFIKLQPSKQGNEYYI